MPMEEAHRRKREKSVNYEKNQENAVIWSLSKKRILSRKAWKTVGSTKMMLFQ